MIENLTISWLIHEHAGKQFVREVIYGDIPAANGDVMIGPFHSEGAAKAMMYHRQEAFADLFKSDRERLERQKVEVARELAKGRPDVDEDEAA